MGISADLGLHASVAAWADSRFEEPTPIQRKGIPVILSGRDALLIAPTGTGKTEAALLPIVSLLLTGPDRRGPGVSLVYVTPLRALNRDMLRRTEEFCGAVGLTIAVRHGDTPQSERQKQAKRPPDILITTPETLQLLLYGPRLREHLASVRHVVVDEIHELAGSERGLQLSIGLERLARIARFQRVGLSATVGNPPEVAAFLGGARGAAGEVGRRVEIVDVSAAERREVLVVSPPAGPEDEKAGRTMGFSANEAAVLRHMVARVGEHSSTLLFVNTRQQAESLAYRLALMEPPFAFAVHHGSLSRDARVDAEEAFKRGDLKLLIATSSLELGIDIGSIEYVIQFTSPRQATRMLQRLGRSGHRIGAVAKGEILAFDPLDLAESAAVARRTLASMAEPQRVRQGSLTVLGNQLLAAAVAQKEVSLDEFYSAVSAAHPFRSLTPALLEETAETLASLRLLRRDAHAVQGGGRARAYFVTNVGMILDERHFRVVDAVSRKVSGQLDERFAATLAIGDAFILRGRAWEVVGIEGNDLLASAVSDIAKVPVWIGEEIPVPEEVAREALGLLGDPSSHPLDDGARAKLLKFAGGDGAGAPAPDEWVLESKGKEAVLIAPLGTKGCSTLSQLLSALLAARLGEGIAAHPTAYGIAFTLPRQSMNLLKQTIESLEPGTVAPLLRKLLRNSSLYKFRFLYVAKKLGAIGADADLQSLSLDRLAAAFDGTLVEEETLEKIMWDDLDPECLERRLEELRSGRLRLLVRAGFSPLADALRGQAYEVYVPAQPAARIAEIVRARLDKKVVELICLNCRRSSRRELGTIAQKLACHACAGKMLAPVRDAKEARKLLEKKKPDTDEREELLRMHTSADLVLEFGRRAVVALAARGVGPKTAARLLSLRRRTEDEFYRDIVEAEVNYSKTRRFWD
jgi:ATP-dependent Lhr-like helicase